ncbi:MAG: sulfite exporter TauE/SafE family protein [Chloroflexota bacterium]
MTPDSLTNILFVDTIEQLLLLGLIIALAGIVRGCIGFGFSAITVASTSFWLPAVAVVNLVIFLEIAASLSMTISVRKDVERSILIPLCVSAILTSFIGTWLLATLTAVQLQWLIGLYMVAVATLTLIGYEFKGEMTRGRIFGIGLIAGFFNGLAAVGGIFAAWALVGLRQPVRVIRANLAVFFIFVEILFLIGALWNGILTWAVVNTAVVTLIPLVLGIWLGSRLFHRIPEATLKRMVLITLILLSLVGIYKTIF